MAVTRSDAELDPTDGTRPDAELDTPNGGTGTGTEPVPPDDGTGTDAESAPPNGGTGSDAVRPSGRPATMRSWTPELSGLVPRIVVGLALALPVLLVVGVLIASSVLQRSPPAADAPRLTIPAVATPAAASADCSRLLSGLPDAIPTGGGLAVRRVLATPVPAGSVAWGGEGGTAPIVLRCGLPRPAELTPTAALLDVNGVEWLEVPAPEAPGSRTWVTVDRGVFVGLTLPDGVGSGAIQDVSRGVKITLASRPVGG